MQNVIGGFELQISSKWALLTTENCRHRRGKSPRGSLSLLLWTIVHTVIRQSANFFTLHAIYSVD